MPEPHPHDSPGRETTALPGRPFALLVAGLFVFLGITYGVMAALTGKWTHGLFPMHGPVRGPQATPGWTDAAPQLQVKPVSDLQQLRLREDLNLHRIAWTDSTHAYATISIEQAMTLLVQAQTQNRLNQLLPPPQPATPVQLQNQKSGAVAPTPTPVASP